MGLASASLYVLAFFSASSYRFRVHGEEVNRSRTVGKQLGKGTAATERDLVMARKQSRLALCGDRWEPHPRE